MMSPPWAPTPTCAAVSLTLLSLFLLTLPPLVPAPPGTFVDLFVSNCTAIPETSPAFLPWSSASTWQALGLTGIPGVGAKEGVNLTIPCGKAVLLDVPRVNLTTLTIRGHLKVNDPAVYMEYNVISCHVLVEGQLTIGSFTNQFKSKITFTLMPNPNNRANWTASNVWPAEPAYPRNMGHKSFAVMGGQVSLHGMPGGASTPSWIKLNATMQTGDFRLIVDTDVSNVWPVGARIAVASTDYTPDRAEEFTIAGFDWDPRGTVILLETKAQFSHYGDPYGIPDGFGGYIDERAEVALLSRQIVITGLDEQNTPYVFEGGHFIIFMTPVPQFIEGVQYLYMGQQGNLGRYNIHFHVCQDTRGLSVVRKNAITHSKQRCVVVHSTHNLTVEYNVAYNTSGHCFMTEEGGEQNNTFQYNLGFRTRSVVNLIASDETDDRPSTFWITNMMNNYIGNVAAGSDSSGFWTELRDTVRGMSLGIPALLGIVPRFTPFGKITNNVAHSNRNNGWQFYPKGVDPRVFWNVNQTTLSTWQWPRSNGYIYNLQVHKQQGDGVFMHNSASAYLVNLTAADNNIGLNFRTNAFGGVVGSRFLALSNNLGTPSNCTRAVLTDNNWPMYCAPASGCTVINNPSTWRFRHWNHWQNPTFGIHFDWPSQNSDGGQKYLISNNSFSGYDLQCNRPSAGVGSGFQGSTWWFNAGQYLEGVRLNPPSSPPALFAAQGWSYPTTSGGTPTNISYSEARSSIALWDKDGSVVGGNGGVLLGGADPSLLPPLRRYSCTPKPEWNAVACPGACYRSLRFWYLEDGFGSAPAANRSRGDFSYLIIRRVEDNVVKIVDGNSNDTSPNMGTLRYFWVNLLAPATYEISIGLPFKKLNFWPGNMSVSFWDKGGCGAGITLRFMAIPANQWALATSDNAFWSPCPGTTWSGQSVPWIFQFQYVCHRQRQVMQVTILGNQDSSQPLFLVASGQRVLPCTLQSRCGVWSSSDWYLYNTSAQELRPPKPGAMGYYVSGYNTSTWNYGQAIIGNSGWGWSAVKTTVPVNNATNGYTYYYRKTFTLQNSACYGGLFLDFIPLLGHLVFLNGVEVFRWNLPAGNITNKTTSLSGPPWPNPFLNSTYISITSINASFVEGTNYLAAETHSPNQWNYSPYFDTRLALLMNSVVCKGAAIMPEVCDGLDNNFDGLVDVDPVTGNVLSRPCATACGTGIETCIDGAYQNCTATPSLPEVCNGKDDNCDGLVDNGLANTRLNCAPGNVCFQGQCLPQGPLTVPRSIFPPASGGWFYLDSGWIYQSYPKWRTGQFSANPNNTNVFLMKPGAGPFGTSNYSGPINTTIKLQSSDIYYFFLKNFTLSAADAASTYSLSVNAKRDNGVIVWSNGVEIMRNNFPSTWNPPTDQYTYPLKSGTNWTMYWPNSPTRSTGIANNAVRAGNNWVAVQVANTQWQSNANFDLELIRNVNQSCSALPGSPSTCVRNPPNDTVFFTSGSIWKYIDASYPLPPYSWILPSFDDSSWPSGPSPLGNSGHSCATVISMNKTTRLAYYFRKTFSVPDATCIYNVFFNLRALDGAVVYVNGIEVYRFQWQGEWVFPTNYSSSNWPSTDRASFNLTTGWLIPGINTVTAEIHPSSANTGSWIFDLTVGAQREAVNCSPLPL